MSLKIDEFDEIDEEYFAGLSFGVIISILIGVTSLGVIILANWLYTFCECGGGVKDMIWR